jgi:hypothetical protein
VRLSINFKDLDRLVGRTCCKSATIIVKDSIVLQKTAVVSHNDISFESFLLTIISSWPELEITCVCEVTSVVRFGCGTSSGTDHDADHICCIGINNASKVSPSPMCRICGTSKCDLFTFF